MSPRPSPGPGAVTARLRSAMATADWPSLVDVLHPNVTWGPPEGGGGCRGRSPVLSRCARLHADGLRVTVEETFTYPAAVVLGLRTHRAVAASGPESALYQVYDIIDGLITRITGYTDRTQALDAAYAAAPRGEL